MESYSNELWISVDLSALRGQIIKSLSPIYERQKDVAWMHIHNICSCYDNESLWHLSFTGNLQVHCVVGCKPWLQTQCLLGCKLWLFSLSLSLSLSPDEKDRNLRIVNHGCITHAACFSMMQRVLQDEERNSQVTKLRIPVLDTLCIVHLQFTRVNELQVSWYPHHGVHNMRYRHHVSLEQRSHEGTVTHQMACQEQQLTAIVGI